MYMIIVFKTLNKHVIYNINYLFTHILTPWPPHRILSETQYYFFEK